MGGPALA